jgi:type I restriction-modification system DNA methylase subunit
MHEHKKSIVKMIERMSGKYAPYNIFSDWVQLCALAIQNSVCMIHDRHWKDREQLYVDTARKYTDAELENFAEMFVWLGDALTEEFSDVLGEIYMECDMGNKYTGQFFTPFHLSELCARLGIKPDDLSEADKLTLNEPSCGGGGMIIAACKVLHEAGFDYQRKLNVVAQDLDWKGVYMTYLQLSLIGCRAIVVQGDTLLEPYTRNYDRGRLMRTPAYMGVIV